MEETIGAGCKAEVCLPCAICLVVSDEIGSAWAKFTARLAALQQNL
jgi:hypothetical protein